MIIYPAIDLRGGKVVRLREGDPEQQTLFSDDPLATARQWLGQGADWIHMVNLDGAFDQASENLRILEAVAGLGAKVQFGGGLRDRSAIAEARSAGAERLVIGTLAAREPETVARAVDEFGAAAICVALDAKDGVVTTHGWTERSRHSPIELGKRLFDFGARHALYTDVARDGGMSGVNIDDTITLAEATGLSVIASGGVSRLSEIRRLAASGRVAGAVIGMALYKKQFTLAEAIEAARRD